MDLLMLTLTLSLQVSPVIATRSNVSKVKLSLGLFRSVVLVLKSLQYIDILSEPTSTTTSTVKNKTSKGSRVVLFRSPEGVSASRRQF